jgi:hypothetical protein
MDMRCGQYAVRRDLMNVRALLVGFYSDSVVRQSLPSPLIVNATDKMGRHSFSDKGQLVLSLRGRFLI